MVIHNIASYKFVPLTDLTALRAVFFDLCRPLELRGTILLSLEGINVSLGGTEEAIAAFKEFLKSDSRFADMTFRESVSDFQPFRRLKVKLRNEIITMGRPEVNPAESRASSISPVEFKQWLDENRDVTVLDTRNEYEVEFGTFDKAISLQTKDFGEFPEKSLQISKDKPIVMFCTGGVRCEKAAIHMQNAGYENIFQLEGGILNYFAEVGGDHYHGNCFVFDGRVALDPQLKTTGLEQCCICQRPVESYSEHTCHQST